ncbi:MAG: hypothetical protein ACJ747_02015 [Gaiellaceae bacterium]
MVVRVMRTRSAADEHAVAIKQSPSPARRVPLGAFVDRAQRDELAALANRDESLMSAHANK